MPYTAEPFHRFDLDRRWTSGDLFDHRTGNGIKVRAAPLYVVENY
jgi:hypothetical protein